MRFRLIDAAKKEFPVQRLCKVLGVSQSGYFARKDRPACRRQHEDMVLLAHIRSAFALSNATYGSPRMTRELRDDGITIGRHRVARLMRENALKARQRRRFKRTTDSLHAFPPMSGHARAGSTLPSSLTSLPGASSAGPPATGSIRNWRCWPYAGPSPCGVHPPGSFTTRTVAANTAPSSTRLS